MNGRLNVHVVRRLAAAKFFAALLIALTVSPFTAPFATIDIAELVGGKTFDATAPASKLAQDLTDCSFITASVLPQDIGVSRAVACRFQRTLARPVLVLVLRI